MDVIRRVLFREPAGRRKALLFSLFSGICILGWAYFGVVLDGPHIMLFLGVAFGCSGYAESLPQNRRRSAAVLRFLGLDVLVALTGLLVLAPELILD
ncbi:hypothetical protein [Haloarcula brevis]|uniref:hypothetical protein n=1 Tax=Haloarcula brevis TaxID=3111453 RepID=UPI00300F7AE3